MTDLLLETRQGAVVTLVLNRPEAMNALSRALIAALSGRIKTLSQDDSLRAIVLTGQGRAFSAGVDLKELAAAGDVSNALDWSGSDSLHDIIRACPHPVIAAINGFAVTGGLELALMADFLIAGPEARFADTHARVGITPSWGMTQILPRLIGINRARQMSLTGGFVDAETALAWGLVNEIVQGDLLARAQELAQQIAETDPKTMTRIRALIGQSAETTLSDGLAREVAQFSNHIAGVTAQSVGESRQKVTARGRALNSTKSTKG